MTDYKNITITDTGLQTKDKTAKDDNELNKKCEVQLTESMYQKLQKKLEEALKTKKESQTRDDIASLNKQKDTLKDEITKAKDTLNKTQDNFTSLKESIDKLNVNDVNNVSRIDQKSVTDIITNVKTQLKKTKSIIDELNGGLISGGVFSKVDKTVDEIKKGTVDLSKYITHIDLGEDITGKLYTSGFRLQDRNINGEECTLISVNAKDKVYTVRYGTGKTVTVKQKDLCLV